MLSTPLFCRKAKYVVLVLVYKRMVSTIRFLFRYNCQQVPLPNLISLRAQKTSIIFFCSKSNHCSFNVSVAYLFHKHIVSNMKTHHQSKRIFKSKKIKQ